MMFKKIFLLLFLGVNINSVVLAETDQTTFTLSIKGLDKDASEKGIDISFSDLAQKSLKQPEEEERARQQEGYKRAIMISLLVALCVIFPR